ncbi:MAG TPA: hypothetical protein VF192_00170 [Longimicrobiales bacterium]
MDRRGRQEALRRRSIGIGLAVSLVVHALAFALVRLRVDSPPAGAGKTMRLLPRVQAVRPIEPRPPELIRLREPEARLAAVEPAPALPDPAAVRGLAPRLAGTPPAPLTEMPAFPVPAPLAPDEAGAADDPLGVPLYEPGTVGKVKRGWLTAAGLNPHGAAVAVWVVGCPALRTVISAGPRPTYRGRPCH